MTYKYVLEGLIPSKKNSKQIINVKRKGKLLPMLIPSVKHKDWHNSAEIQLMKFMHPGNPIIECKKIEILLFFGSSHRADLTNKAESIMDLLVDCNILSDDSFQVVPELHLIGKYRKGEPGAEITIIV